MVSSLGDHSIGLYAPVVYDISFKNAIKKTKASHTNDNVAEFLLFRQSFRFSCGRKGERTSQKAI